MSICASWQATLWKYYTIISLILPIDMTGTTLYNDSTFKEIDDDKNGKEIHPPGEDKRHA